MITKGASWMMNILLRVKIVRFPPPSASFFLAICIAKNNIRTNNVRAQQKHQSSPNLKKKKRKNRGL